MDEIRSYLGLTSENDFEYDFALLDIDTYQGYCDFKASEAIKNYFVTSFDVYSLKRGIEALSGLENVTTLTKILFSKDMLREEDEYLEFLAMGCKVEWEKEKIYFPFDVGDNSVIVENQRNARISYKELSPEYKEGILNVISEIAPEIRINDVKKILKNI